MKYLIPLALIVLIRLTTYAQNATGKIDNREAEQRTRIRQGRASGDLTNKEATRLNRQQHHIHRTELRAKADGKVTNSTTSKIAQAAAFVDKNATPRPGTSNKILVS